MTSINNDGSNLDHGERYHQQSAMDGYNQAGYVVENMTQKYSDTKTVRISPPAKNSYDVGDEDDDKSPDDKYLPMKKAAMLNQSEASTREDRNSPGNWSKASSGFFCRICHDGDAMEPLISPCYCSGSVALVHRSCIEKWLSTSNHDTCELCNHKYLISRQPRPFSRWLCEPAVQDDHRNMLGDVVCFFLLTPLAAVSTYLCGSGAVFYLQEKKSESIGLICLSVILIVIYITWLFLTLKYHFQVWKQWRKTNQDIRLEDVGRPVQAEKNKKAKNGSKTNSSKRSNSIYRRSELYTIDIDGHYNQGFDQASVQIEAHKLSESGILGDTSLNKSDGKDWQSRRASLPQDPTAKLVFEAEKLAHTNSNSSSAYMVSDLLPCSSQAQSRETFLSLSGLGSQVLHISDHKEGSICGSHVQLHPPKAASSGPLSGDYFLKSGHDQVQPYPGSNLELSRDLAGYFSHSTYKGPEIASGMTSHPLHQLQQPLNGDNADERPPRPLTPIVIGGEPGDLKNGSSSDSDYVIRNEGVIYCQPDNQKTSDKKDTLTIRLVPGSTGIDLESFKPFTRPETFQSFKQSSTDFSTSHADGGDDPSKICSLDAIADQMTGSKNQAEPMAASIGEDEIMVVEQSHDESFDRLIHPPVLSSKKGSRDPPPVPEKRSTLSTVPFVYNRARMIPLPGLAKTANWSFLDRRQEDAVPRSGHN